VSSVIHIFIVLSRVSDTVEAIPAVVHEIADGLALRMHRPQVLVDSLDHLLRDDIIQRHVSIPAQQALIRKQLGNGFQRCSIFFHLLLVFDNGHGQHEPLLVVQVTVINN